MPLDCQDQLLNTTHTSEVVAFASVFDAFSFDMLQALVAEMNYYSETPDEALKWLNIKLDLGESRIDTYLIQQLVVAGKDITEKIERPTWTGNPATSNLVEIHVYAHGWMSMGYKSWQIQFSPRSHLISGSVTSGEYVFVDDLRKTRAVLLRAARQNTNAVFRVNFWSKMVNMTYLLVPLPFLH
jgi:hypothetical protein